MILLLGSLLWAADATESESRQAARAFLASEAPGGFAAPLVLTPPALNRLCGVLNVPATDTNAFERGLARRQRSHAESLARHQIFQLDFDAKGFVVGDYDFENETLPLDLQRPLLALDGALRVAVVDTRGAAFHLAPSDAQPIAERLARQELSLRVTFQLDGGEPSPCFSLPWSEAWSVRARPLTYALLAPGAVLAQTRTHRWEKVARWIAPGEATVRLTARRLAGTISEAALETAASSAEAPLLQCLAALTADPFASGTLAYQADAQPTGSLAALHPVLEALDDAPEDCVRQVLEQIRVPKSTHGARLELVVALERTRASP